MAKEVLVELIAKKHPTKFNAGNDELLNLKKATIERFADKELSAGCIPENYYCEECQV